MRIAFFTQNFKKGGLDTFLVNLIVNWPTNDQVTLFCNRSHPGLTDLQRLLGGRAKIVPYNFWIAQDIETRLSNAPRVYRLFARTLFWVFGFFYLVCRIHGLFRQSRPDRLMVINGGYPGGDACLAATVAWPCTRLGAPAWHNFHNLVLPYSRQPIRRLKEHLVDFWIARSAAGFVTVSAACRDTLALRPILATARRTYVYNGIDPINVARGPELVTEFGLPARSRLVLMLAVYEPRKGHAFVIAVMKEVVRRVPEARLVVCGAGSSSEMAAVRRMCDESGIGAQIVLRGHRYDLGNLLSQVEVLVIPSQGQESFGYTAVEAMACGCPVVVSDVGGLPEVVADGVCGYVVHREDIQTFADRVVALLQDKTLRQRMGEAGRVRYRSLFQARRMSREYCRLINAGTA